MIQEPEESKTSNKQKDRENIPFWRVMLSVIQASFGVQSADNKNRDFAQGKLLPFILAAVIFTVCFVLLIMLVVNLAIN